MSMPAHIGTWRPIVTVPPLKLAVPRYSTPLVTAMSRLRATVLHGAP